MKLLGTIFLLFAACTISLDFLGHNSDLLVIMDRWGADAGDAIRIVIGGLGIILLRMPKRRIAVETVRDPVSVREHSVEASDPMAELRNKPGA